MAPSLGALPPGGSGSADDGLPVPWSRMADTSIESTGSTALAGLLSGDAIGSRTSSECGRLRTEVVLVPVGSCEQHGPHLPLDTDTRIAVAIAERVGAGMAGTTAGPVVTVAPAITYGASGEHQSFAGTVSIGSDALKVVLIELGRSLADQCRLLVFVNGHGGNLDALFAATELLHHEGRPVLAWSPSFDGASTDSHAGRIETSLMLAISPHLVHTNRAVAGNSAPLESLLPTLRTRGVAAVSPNGVLGDPAGATADEGVVLLDVAISALTTAIRQALIANTHVIADEGLT